MDTGKNCTISCADGQGSLPGCGQLAAAYVPMQRYSPQKYQNAEALARGTLFPGLDLPFMNSVNTVPMQFVGTPAGELMALGFVVHELGLYLDTHAEDTEALKLFIEYSRLLKQGQNTYAERYGPLVQTQVGGECGWSWLNDPWPWERGSAEERMDG